MLGDPGSLFTLIIGGAPGFEALTKVSAEALSMPVSRSTYELGEVLAVDSMGEPLDLAVSLGADSGRLVLVASRVDRLIGDEDVVGAPSAS